jgi:YcxB-like protein
VSADTSAVVPDVVEGKLTLSAEDLDLGAAAMPEHTRMRFSLRLYGGALVLFGIVGGELTHAALAPRLIWIAIGIGLVVHAQLRRPAQGARLIAAMKDGEREVSYRFDSQGLSIKTPVSETSLQYTALHREIEGQTAFVLYTQERIAQIIPKRAFDPSGVARIRQWLGVQVQARPKPKSFLRMALIWAVLVVVFLVIWNLLVKR